jgi:hypothetical protein
MMMIIDGFDDLVGKNRTPMCRAFSLSIVPIKSVNHGESYVTRSDARSGITIF